MNAAPNTNTASTHAKYLSVWDVQAYYGESYIVQGVSFDIHEGEILALLGRNGAGKTSTLRTIARLDDPALTHGEIWLDHQPLHDMKAWQAAQAGIALVPEDRRIIPGLTVEENLQLAQIAPPKGWSIDRVYDLFPRLRERRKQEGVTLSGGEQQMLAIARALVRDITIAIIEHDMHVVFSLADRITVLAQGTPLVEDVPERIKGHPKVQEAYLGETHA